MHRTIWICAWNGIYYENFICIGIVYCSIHHSAPDFLLPKPRLLRLDGARFGCPDGSWYRRRNTRRCLPMRQDVNDHKMHNTRSKEIVCDRLPIPEVYTII